MSEADELYEMVNIYPADSGLPMTVWAGPRGNARHDVRIKVNMAHGNRMTISNTAVVAVRPAPRLIAGRLSSADLQAVSAWLRLNEAALVAHWDGQIYQHARRRQPEGENRDQALPASDHGCLGIRHEQVDRFPECGWGMVLERSGFHSFVSQSKLGSAVRQSARTA